MDGDVILRWVILASRASWMIGSVGAGVAVVESLSVRWGPDPSVLFVGSILLVYVGMVAESLAVRAVLSTMNDDA